MRRAPDHPLLRRSLLAALLLALIPAREAIAQRPSPIAASRAASFPQGSLDVGAHPVGDCSLAVCPVSHERLGWQITGAVIGAAVGLLVGTPQHYDSAGHSAAVSLLAASLGGAGGFWLGGVWWDSSHRVVITR